MDEERMVVRQNLKKERVTSCFSRTNFTGTRGGSDTMKIENIPLIVPDTQKI
jgi:hypothetical protein